ncbi:MAG: transcriptional regulator, LacI family, partial [Glaciihabitans sp.]|nr:transcriptional regulator, LacI family [Glaciihabitans sp.]
GRIEGIPTLSIDDVEAARVATAHLLSLGHTRIMHLGGDQHEQMDFRVHAQRLSGFEQAMQDAGRSTADVRAVPFSIPGGYATALRILADPRTRPTAIVAGCDEIAIGVILAARQLGIQVPTQLSVIGIDDHYLAEMFALTTLSQAPEAQGRMAVDLLMNELRQPSRPESVERITVPVRLRVRSSTTAPARPA